MSSRIAVIGLGYVGCVSAACLSQIGHVVAGIDRDEFKVASVNDGLAPFFEPGLADIVRDRVAAGELRATSSLMEGIADADVAFVCVGTPSEKNGNLGLQQLKRVVAEIADTLPGRTKPLIVAIRSTVFPGTCEEVVMAPFQQYPLVRVVSNPEFLREGVAVRDFMEPSLLVVGGNDSEAAGVVADLYKPLRVTPSIVSLRTAEMIKYACNAYHAVKISFANEMGALAAAVGADPHEVMNTLCTDTKLNTSAAYLKPGFAFGGSCLPKDLRALNFRANRLDLKLPMLGSALRSNDEHLGRAIASVLDLPSKRTGVVGLAFKENTDDLRESPVVTLLEQLIGKGRDVRVFDPHIRLDAIYGSNRDFILQQIPHIGRLLASSFEDVSGWADYLVVAQSPGAELKRAIQASSLPVLDLTGGALTSQANVAEHASI
jgi:GDP-mannose 6-dehydrogenase